MKYAILVLVLGLAGCAELQAAFPAEPDPDADAVEAAMPVETPPETLNPAPPPPPPETASTVDEFDTTTEEDRQAALEAPPSTGEVALGATLATLGDPADPGIWISTPLVTELVMGRAEVPGTGKTVTLELRPSGGAAGSGSEISLPAMRLLEIPLTAIQELLLYTGGTA